MLTDDVISLYKKFRLLNYRHMFGKIREKDGSLSATEAFATDVIYLLGNPTVSQLADTLGISQPNATYKANNLSAKGYVTKTVSEDDRRECRLTVAERFHLYYDNANAPIQKAVEKLSTRYTPEEMELFGRMLRSLNEIIG